MLFWTLRCVYFFKLVFSFFYGYIPRKGIAGSYDSFTFSFWRGSSLFFKVTDPIYISTNSVREFPFLHILINVDIHGLFDDGHSDMHEGYLIVILICISLMINDV